MPAEREPLSDLTIRETAAGEIHDLHLALRQSGRSVAVREVMRREPRDLIAAAGDVAQCRATTSDPDQVKDLDGRATRPERCARVRCVRLRDGECDLRPARG